MDDGQLGCVQFVTITNDAAVNILYKSPETLVQGVLRSKACSFCPNLLLPGCCPALGSCWLSAQIRSFQLLQSLHSPLCCPDVQPPLALSCILLPPPRALNPTLLPGPTEAPPPSENSLRQCCWSSWYYLL